MEKKTKIEIIEEVASHYNLNNRAVDITACLYTSSKGNHCAVGRFLLPEYQTEDFEYNEGYSIGELVLTSGKKSLDSFLRKEVRGNTIGFWEDLQNFHDIGENFTDTGLSVDGEELKKALINKYK